MKLVNVSKKAMLAVLSCTLMLGSVSATAAVPVFDFKSVIQAKIQVDQLKAQLQALTGNGNYADILNNPALRKQLNQYLPKGYNDIFEAAQKGDLGALQQVVNKAIQKEKYVQGKQTGAERAAATRLLTGASLDSMMNSLQAESYQLDSLVQKINTTHSSAEKQDLMNAIGAKQAQLNLKIGQMQIMMKQAEWQQKQADKQASSDYWDKVMGK